MVTKNHIISKSLYGLLFVVVLPVLLTLWVSATAQWIALPVLDVPLLRWSLSILGGLMLLSGMLGLLLYGHGMPMNPYPPNFYVARGGGITIMLHIPFIQGPLCLLSVCRSSLNQRPLSG